MFKTLCIAIFIGFSCILALKFEGNVSLKDESFYSFRESSVIQWSNTIIGVGLLNGIAWQSISANGASTNSSGEGAVDAIFGCTYTAFKVAPTSYVLGFSAKGLLPPMDKNDNYQMWSFKASLGAIAIVYVKLDEVVSGEIKQTIWLSDINFNSQQEMKSESEGLRGFETSGKGKGDMKVTIYNIVADRMGKVDIADAIIVPTGLETIFEIEDFPYVDENNGQIVFTFAIATVGASASTAGSFTTVANGDYYVSFNGKAEVEDSLRDVTVNFEASTSWKYDFKNSWIESQMESKYGSKAELYLANVTFPAGAKKIVYDPAVGAGKPPVTTLSAGTIAGIVIAVVIVILLFVGLAFFFIRRRQYHRI